ncbi:metal-sensing transcriptional repressor, partial [Micrococcus luteus]
MAAIALVGLAVGVLNRLKRARGQLDAVIREVEGEGRCKDVVT